MPARRALGWQPLLTRPPARPSPTQDAINPREATVEERRNGGVTKARYLQYRDGLTSTTTLGFRVDAAQVSKNRGKEVYPVEVNFRELRDRNKLHYTFKTFFQESEIAARAVLIKLERLRTALGRSGFFHRHALVRSSILITYDDEALQELIAKGSSAQEMISLTSPAAIEVKMIDFAHSHPVFNRTLTHRQPWAPGSHEDGYLTGLDSLIDLVKEVEEVLAI